MVPLTNEKCFTEDGKGIRWVPESYVCCTAMEIKNKAYISKARIIFIFTYYCSQYSCIVKIYYCYYYNNMVKMVDWIVVDLVDDKR